MATFDSELKSRKLLKIQSLVNQSVVIYIKFSLNRIIQNLK